ncbi:MAG TPA: hypothetical protein VJA23_05780 [Candidatus Nanoarchaeia archaeon]|nr:hypothetical protein [Candidatus Nanoarchaeia archaeon]
MITQKISYKAMIGSRSLDSFINVTLTPAAILPLVKEVKIEE